ncbi:MAG: asparagine synthase (glutamine-hydrolyzing) [Magnetococcales bacterium]|nr:asparagine synthase (glutamine-hydrolyzing) [Magnetococcales bacterium]
MSGIAAIYNYGDLGSGVKHAEFHSMVAAMESHGPDGGVWFQKQNRVALGHRRLATIDLDRRSNQPMVGVGGRHVISFNGVIYNYLELGHSLAAKGYNFKTNSDTEVLLALWQLYGEDMVHHIRGMYAFVIWDSQRQGLFMARDPYGIRSLYYADDGSSIRVASQVKVLLNSPAISKQRDVGGEVGFLLFGYVPEPFTIYSDIKALPAGSSMWIDSSGISSPKKYFNLPAQFSKKAEGGTSVMAAQEYIRNSLLDTLSSHLKADEKVGLFLSGGIDSGVLLGLMAELGRDYLPTVTLGFVDKHAKDNDITIAAQTVAKHYDMENKLHIIQPKDFNDDWPEIIQHMDQPSINGINSWFVSKTAKQMGIKVALTDVGGDELFGGYPSFYDIPLVNRLFTIPAKIPGLGRGIREVMGRFLLPKTSLSPKLAGMVEYGGSMEGAYLLKRGLFMPWELPNLLGIEATLAGLDRLDPLGNIRQFADNSGKNINSYSAIASMESSLYLKNQLLRDMEWSGLAHGVELRTPFVDINLTKTVAPLLNTHGTQLLGRGKPGLVNSLLYPLPTNVLKRKKSGFEQPHYSWIQNTDDFKGIKKVSALNCGGCHWSRRMAYHLLQNLT